MKLFEIKEVGGRMRTLSIALPAGAPGHLCPLPHTTGPTEVGVRIIKWSLFAKKGVESHVYEPGALYFFPLVLNDCARRYQAAERGDDHDPKRRRQAVS